MLCHDVSPSVLWDMHPGIWGDGVHGNSMKEPEMIVSSEKETLRRMSTDTCLSGC